MTSPADLLASLAIDSRYFILDNFLTDHHLTGLNTQTASSTIKLCDTNIQTGIQSGSAARVNYTYPLFNPRYSELFLQLRLSSIDDVIAYFGFVETIETPTIDMTQSHAGIFIKDGVVSWSTGNGSTSAPTYQNTKITQLDVTRDIIYKFANQRMNWFPLPQIQPSFEYSVVKSELSKWSNEYSNGSALPADTTHYFMAYIENTTNLNKQIILKRFFLNERWPD